MDSLRYVWLPRLCFGAALAVAVVLVAAVLLAPQVTLVPEPALVTLFARDLAVRRTALASAVGLVVTAFVFFRPTAPRPAPAKQEASPGTVAGA